jgi:hypothetical protein
MTSLQKRDYFSEEANVLRNKGIVHRVKVGDERGR